MAAEILGSTLAWCTVCQKSEPARYEAQGNGVYLVRSCSKAGSQKVKAALTRQWFMDRRQGGFNIYPPWGTKEIKNGCPLDCGICLAHLGGLRLPIFSITNQCQLACPICFTHNRRDLVYHKSLDELKQILDNIEKISLSLDLINLTGGEPTLHPNLPEVLSLCAQRSFGQVSVNTNGLILAENAELAEKILESGAEVILSLDTLTPKISHIIHGTDITPAKRKALERLERLGIPTVLLPVWIPGVNDLEIPLLIKEYFHRSFIKGVTIQTITYTGFHGSNFSPKTRATLEEVENGLGAAGFRPQDFFRHGSYHPLCYSVAYYLIDDQTKIPLTALADSALLTAGTSGSYLLKPTREIAESIRQKIDDLWAAGAPRAELNLLKKLVQAFSAGGDYPDGQIPPDAVKNSGLIKTLTLHAHMDAENFDLSRITMCGDLVPEEDGRFRPACAYNILYRSQDPRFWAVKTETPR
jgi:uncharacterized radical SAM superfamily Fe-S cluster-containing enzyme